VSRRKIFKLALSYHSIRGNPQHTSIKSVYQSTFNRTRGHDRAMY